MASSHASTRSVAAGLSCGIGLAVPVAAYAVTLPFEGVHGAIAASAVPFAVGALAGVGLFAASNVLLDRHVAFDAEDTAADAAPAHTHEGVAARAAGLHAGLTGLFARSDDEYEDNPDVERFFGRRRVPKDVPVIARAQWAPSEAEAWADIDAILSEDSPISCDATRSKDIYEIALEELRQSQDDAAAQPAGAHASSAGAAAAPVRTWEPSASAPAETTATFMALAAEIARGTETTARIEHDEDEDTDAARLAALASLDVIDGERPHRTPVSEPARVPAPEMPVMRGAAAAQAAPEPTVPQADYSGHEDMWASALAILAEDESRASTTMPTAVPPSPERAQAVDEGARATAMHSRVNSLIEEEFDQVPSQSVRRTSREYLRVIQGGTASFPRLRAEEA